MRDAIWSRTLPEASRLELEASEGLPPTADVVVVGAGLVGLCVALSLRRRGVGNVVVVDRTSICGESTGASAGGLWPSHECLAFAAPEIARRARDSHARLRDEFGCDYVPSGLLAILEEEELGKGLERVRRTLEAGFQAELLTGAALQEREPLLRRCAGAVYFPGDGSLHPLKLAAGMAAWLRRNGVRICLGQEVVSVNGADPAISTACAGTLSAGAVVIAAGAWTPILTKLLGWQPPIRPMRGTLIAAEGQPSGTLRSVVVGSRYYYWQLAAGPLAGGGSEEDVGFSRDVSDDVVSDILREFTLLFPSLGGMRFPFRWSGFRPFCEDMHPVIGRVPGTRRVYVSAGHFRKGILLAPLSGELLANEMLERKEWGPASMFRPDRFASSGPSGSEPG